MLKINRNTWTLNTKQVLERQKCFKVLFFDVEEWCFPDFGTDFDHFS
jgi:hypothetical protein